MNLFGIGGVIESVGKVVDDLVTTDEELAKIELEKQKIDADLIKGQLEINKIEAQHKSVFVAGWRPFIGWVGGIALAYQFILYPLAVWIWSFLKAKGVIPPEFSPPPVFESGPLFAIITGMLGVGGLRTFDKMKGTQTDRIKN